MIFFLADFPLMRGYCPKCKEYRSDNSTDAWKIIWRNNLAICERCGSIVDLWINKNKIYPGIKKPKKLPEIVRFWKKRHKSDNCPHESKRIRSKEKEVERKRVKE